MTRTHGQNREASASVVQLGDGAEISVANPALLDSRTTQLYPSELSMREGVRQ
jgi:hypothetical protein